MSVENLPETWRAAVDELIRSAAEPGHPWSCSGGSIDLGLAPKGAVLRVAREGEPPVARQVAVPDDVVPLGQALLAAPLAPGPKLEGPKEAAPPALPAAPATSESNRGDGPAPSRGQAAPTAPRKEARILLGGGVDGRALGNSNIGWIGPAVSAAVPMGRWLPSISLRQQSAIFSDGPPIDELSVAFALQFRFVLRALELRAGLALRGAAVLRDLPRPQGTQSELQGRVGVVTSIVVPIVRWASLVISADGDVVGLSRRTAEPTSTGSTAPKAFPTYTLGGSAGIEVPL